jgi:dihydroorotase
MISRRRLLAGFSLGSALPGQTVAYDLLLKNGQVIDPRNNRHARFDTGIRGGRIVSIAGNVPAARARQVVDAGNYCVTLGLIDIQTHFDFLGAGFNLQPDRHAFPNGVTTAVDAGSSGHKGPGAFKKRIIDASRTRILTWLSIAGEQTSEMDAAACAAVAKKHPGIIVGIQTAHSRVDRALEAGMLSGTPVMADFQPAPERGFQELLGKRMRPGNVLTHSYSLDSAVLDSAKTSATTRLRHGSEAFCSMPATAATVSISGSQRRRSKPVSRRTPFPPASTRRVSCCLRPT